MPTALLLADDAKPDDSPPSAPSSPDESESAPRLPIPAAIDQEKARKSFASNMPASLPIIRPAVAWRCRLSC
jgi:hypothetical protein